MEWYLPTFYGDVKLISTDKGKGTTLVVSNLTDLEKKAIEELATKATRGKKPWAERKAFKSLAEGGYRALTSIDLLAPIGRVQAILAKALKPNRKLLSAVLFRDGTMEETYPPAGASAEGVGVTVAAPTAGCPSADFEAADLRATRVLSAFLSRQQRLDFRRLNRFVSFGRDTGHRYMVTSRQRPQDLGRYGGMTLYDLDEERPLCVHDWSVPAAEELLALHVFLSVPGRETYLRELRDGD